MKCKTFPIENLHYYDLIIEAFESSALYQDVMFVSQMIKVRIFVFSSLKSYLIFQECKITLYRHSFASHLSMFFTLVLLGSIYISAVNGWGATGHALVAKIAQTSLTQEAQKFVQDYLPWYAKGDLSMLASWPDTILYPDTNPVEYLNWQWSKELHYVNTPDWACNYDRNRDCDWAGGQRCVDGSIQNYTNRLADTSLDSTQRQEALRFLVHFIGDVHQPLHAGFASDRGGNSIKGMTTLLCRKRP